MRLLPRIMSLALATGIALWGRSAASEPIRGVGAALPKTIYAEWARVYEAKTHVAVSYSAMAPTAALGRARVRPRGLWRLRSTPRGGGARGEGL
jgi:hypothetical protein